LEELSWGRFLDVTIGGFNPQVRDTVRSICVYELTAQFRCRVFSLAYAENIKRSRDDLFGIQGGVCTTNHEVFVGPSVLGKPGYSFDEGILGGYGRETDEIRVKLFHG